MSKVKTCEISKRKAAKFVSPRKMATMLRKIAKAFAANDNPGVKVHCRIRVEMFREKP